MIRRFFVKTCIIGLLLIYASSAWAWIEVQVTPDPDVLCVCSEEGKVESETAKVTVDVLKPAPDLSGLIPAAGAKVNIVMTHSELSGEVLNEERTAGADGRVVLDYDTGIFNNKPGFVNIIANAEAEMTICGETCETFMATGTGAAQVTIVKVEIEGPAYICVDNTTNFKAKFLPRQAPGRFKWQITKGQQYAQITTGADKQTVTVKGIKPSQKVNDVSLKLEFKPSGVDKWCKPVYYRFSVVGVEVKLAQSQVCDGESVNIKLLIKPEDAKPLLNNIQFTATKPDGGTNFDSPSGQGITISQRGTDITRWKIDNARWYSTQFDHCNDTSDYKIRASHKVDDTQCKTESVYFTADTTPGRQACLYGHADPIQLFSGSPHYTTVRNPQTGLYETTVSQGTFMRDVIAISWWKAPKNSQYYNMVKDEEQYHEKQQMENPDHPRWGTAYLAENIMNDVQANEPYVHRNKRRSKKLAQKAFGKAFKDEMKRSDTYINRQSIICADEREAKEAVGASHRASMPCTYPDCQ